MATFKLTKFKISVFGDKKKCQCYCVGIVSLLKSQSVNKSYLYKIHS